MRPIIVLIGGPKPGRFTIHKGAVYLGTGKEDDLMSWPFWEKLEDNTGKDKGCYVKTGEYEGTAKYPSCALYEWRPTS